MAQALSMSEDGIKSLLRRIRTALAECIRRRLAMEKA
jgi:DNA-directed RNA polymerase specialized sigma24 family protein